MANQSVLWLVELRSLGKGGCIWYEVLLSRADARGYAEACSYHFGVSAHISKYIRGF